jgi:hypothetical protein
MLKHSAACRGPGALSEISKPSTKFESPPLGGSVIKERAKFAGSDKKLNIELSRDAFASKPVPSQAR